MKKLIFLISLIVATFTVKAQYDTTFSGNVTETFILNYPNNSTVNVYEENGGPITMKPNDYQSNIVQAGNVTWSMPYNPYSSITDSLTTSGPGHHGLSYKKNDDTWMHLDIWIYYNVNIIDSTTGSATYGQMPDTVWIPQSGTATLSVGTSFANVWWFILGNTTEFSTSNTINVPCGTYVIDAYDNNVDSYDTIVVAEVCNLPTNFNVVGGGNYCNGSPVPAIGVDGSQSNVNYQLMNGSIIVHSTMGTNSPFTFTNTSYPAGNFTVLATNACGTITLGTVSLVIMNGYTTTHNTSICQGDSVLIGTTWHHDAGTFVENYTMVNGCDSVITTHLTVLTATAPINLGVDTTVCESITLNATSTVGSSYLWNDGNFNAIRTVTASGTYSVIVTGNCGIVKDTIVVTVVNHLVLTASPVDTMVCAGSTITLHASGTGTSFSWSTSETTPDITVTVNATDTFYVWSSNYCGTVIDSITVYTANPFTMNIVPDSITIIQGHTDTIYVTVDDEVSISWSTGSDSLSTIVSTAGWYYVTVTHAICGSQVDSVHVDVITGISEPADNSKISVKICPNPTSNSIKILGYTDGFQIITIYNQVGQIMTQGLYNSPSITIDVSMYPEGIYYIKLDGTAKPFKFIKIE